jgi:hypothetical protein
MNLQQLLDQLQAWRRRDSVFVEGLDPVPHFQGEGQLVIEHQPDGSWTVYSEERGKTLVDERFASEDELCAFVADQLRPGPTAPMPSHEETYAAAVRMRARMEKYNAGLVAKGLPPAKLPPLPARPE